MENDKLTLASIGCGALEERFQDELLKVINNIRDVNNQAGKRKISIGISFDPGDNDSVDIEFDVKSTLQGPKKLKTAAYVGADPLTGEIIMEEYKKNQLKGQLNIEESIKKVVNIGGK